MTATRFLFYCADDNVPSGGVRKLYRHVDVLNRHGHEAVVLHQKEGFRCSWFANDTAIAYATRTPLTPTDILIIPEVFGPQLASVSPGVRKVIFNQNAYYSFRGYSVNPTDLSCAYLHRDLIGAVVVSEDNREYLSYVFPRLRVLRVRYGVNCAMFSYHDGKKKRIACMPRKNSDHVLQVLNILKFRGAFEGFELVFIDQCSHDQVAELFKECAFFFCFGHPEGWPILPAEAMASGCIVVGYYGNGGREFWHRDFCCPVEFGDVLGFARTAENVLRSYRADPTPFRAMGRAAADFILKNFGYEQEEESILRCWREMADLNLP